MKKYLVAYLLPSGEWSCFTTDDKHEAEDHAQSEQARTGWPHAVYKIKEN